LTQARNVRAASGIERRASGSRREPGGAFRSAASFAAIRATNSLGTPQGGRFADVEEERQEGQEEVMRVGGGRCAVTADTPSSTCRCLTISQQPVPDVAAPGPGSPGPVYGAGASPRALDLLFGRDAADPTGALDALARLEF